MNLNFQNKVFRDANLKNSFYILMGSSMFKALVLGMSFILAYYLESDDFGFFSILKSTSMTLTSLCLYFVNMTIITNVASSLDLRKGINEARIFTYLVMLLFLSGLLMFKVDLQGLLFGARISDVEYYSVIILFLLSLLAGSETGILLGCKEAIIISKVNIVIVLLYPLILYVSILNGAVGAVFGLSFMYLIQILSFRFFLSLKMRKMELTDSGFKINISSYYIYFKESFPLLLLTLATALPFYFAKVYMFVDIGPSMLALFELGYTWLMLIITIINMVQLAIVPAISEAAGQESGLVKILKVKRQYVKITLGLNLVFIIFGIGGIFVMDLIYGLKYDGLGELIVYLLVLSIPYSLYILNEKILTGLKTYWKLLSAGSTYAVAFLAYAFIFDISDGLDVVMAMGVGYTTSFLLSELIIYRILK